VFPGTFGKGIRTSSKSVALSMPQAGAVQTDVPPQPSLDLAAARAQLDEQLRPAFSNLIVGYWSMEG
jgi:hypothetical protein